MDFVTDYFAAEYLFSFLSNASFTLELEPKPRVLIRM